MKRTVSRRRLWVAAPVAAFAALLLAVPASASTVQIDDQSNVLNVTAVQNAAASLPVPIYIWTTTQDSANESTFDTDVREKVSSEFPIVLGINTAAHHESLQIGSASGFTQQSAEAAESSANSAFDGVMRSRNDYTGAVQSAVSSLRTSLANRGGSSGTTKSHGPSLFLGIVVLIILVVVMALLGRLFRGFRRPQRMSGPPMGYGGGGYGGGYGPPPGYGQGYGPGYGQGYGGGISPGAAGGIGAVGGGLLGYELGKMEGENQQFRQDEMMGNQGFGGDQNYGGDQGFGGDQDGGWTVGQDGDWGGGGDSGGDNSGGGGGGDW